MKDSIAARLANLEARLKEIDARLSDPGVVDDLADFRKLSQERSEIFPVVESFTRWRRAGGDLAAAEVWMRPWVSVAGTRCTRWPPDSKRSWP